MDISFVSIITILNPAVIIAALAPFFTALIMWTRFYSVYDAGRLKKTRKTFHKLADSGEKLEGCRKDNLSFMDEATVTTAPEYFIAAWRRMQIQIVNNYQGDYIPEGQSFFDMDEMINIPGCRHGLDSLWKSFWVISVITVMLPFGVAFFVQPEFATISLVLGAMLFMLLCLGQLIFTLADQRMYYSTKIEYRRFIDIFNKVLPVAKAEVALLMEATQRNRDVYEESARRITEKFDGIVEETILPALEDSISVIMNSNLVPVLYHIEKTLDNNLDKTLALHEKGMTSMAETFADHLTDILEEKMAGLASTIVTVQTAMKELNQDLSETLDTAASGMTAAFKGVRDQMEDLNFRLDIHVSALSEMITSQREVLEESGRMLIDSGEIQKKTAADTKEILYQNQENNRVLNEHIQRMTDTLDKLTDQTMIFSSEASQFTKETNEAQLRMSEDIKISQSRLEAAVNETSDQYKKMKDMISDMMDNITGRMNAAMTNAGKEIALGIKEVTADNAEAIANLAEQAEKLRTDYDTYFTRLEDSTLKTLEDMDYQVKNIIARITEDVGAMLKESVQANGEVLERYKDNTADLLQSFDEQARSIGLYAKEINLDIAELSNNLQTSVAEFSGRMQEGVQLTINEFDDGLSELTRRIANTVESICDAVETLPSALDRKQGDR
jgi:gas vesicle protein